MALWVADNMECNVPGAAGQKERFHFCDLILVFIKTVLFDKVNVRKESKIEQCTRGQGEEEYTIFLTSQGLLSSSQPMWSCGGSP